MEQTSGRETKASVSSGDASKMQQAENTLRVWQFQTAEESESIAELDDKVMA